MSKLRCHCNFMELWDPAVTYRRGVIDHSATKCEPTCEGCKDLRSDLSRLRAAVEALRTATGKHSTWKFDRMFGAVEGLDVYDPREFVRALKALLRPGGDDAS